MRNKGLAQRKCGTGQPATGFRSGTRDPRPEAGLDDGKKKQPLFQGRESIGQKVFKKHRRVCIYGGDGGVRAQGRPLGPAGQD